MMANFVLVYWITDKTLTVLPENCVLDKEMLTDDQRVGLVEFRDKSRPPKDGWKSYAARVLARNTNKHVLEVLEEDFVKELKLDDLTEQKKGQKRSKTDNPNKIKKSKIEAARRAEELKILDDCKAVEEKAALPNANIESEPMLAQSESKNDDIVDPSSKDTDHSSRVTIEADNLDTSQINTLDWDVASDLKLTDDSELASGTDHRSEAMSFPQETTIQPNEAIVELDELPSNPTFAPDAIDLMDERGLPSENTRKVDRKLSRLKEKNKLLKGTIEEQKATIEEQKTMIEQQIAEIEKMSQRNEQLQEALAGIPKLLKKYDSALKAKTSNVFTPKSGIVSPILVESSPMECALLSHPVKHSRTTLFSTPASKEDSSRLPSTSNSSVSLPSTSNSSVSLKYHSSGLPTAEKASGSCLVPSTSENEGAMTPPADDLSTMQPNETKPVATAFQTETDAHKQELDKLNDYGRLTCKLMTILFSKDEMRNGVVRGSGNCGDSRTKLDETKVQYIEDYVVSKLGPVGSQNIRQKMSQKCRDIRKSSAKTAP